MSAWGFQGRARDSGSNSTKLVRGLLRGALAGAAGTSALNAVTYLDMAGRGRGASSAPADTVEKVAKHTGISIPGDKERCANRASALGSLNGMTVGVGIGSVLGLAEAAGWRPKVVLAGVACAALAMAMTDVPMAALGVTDPRKWSAADWASDALPHLAFGLVTASALAKALTRFPDDAP